ncbi:MAG: SsgA family sporulation/cell division regulator [Pseudonocardia sp.]|nr:SsgA family sporulation/cell division regulator [Pseudonocardia sp.]
MSTSTDDNEVPTELAMDALLPCEGETPWACHTSITTELSWRPSDPLVVTATIPTSADRAVEWPLSLDLLTAGRDYPVGLGDVSVLPDPTEAARAELVLSTDTGRICLGFAVEDLTDFLARIYSTGTPPGGPPEQRGGERDVC